MAKKKGITPDVKNTAIRFAKVINSVGIPISKLIIFGSYAKGKAGKDSDIDLCLVSPKFGRDPIGELQFLLKRTRDVDDRIEPIPVSSSEYRETATPLIFEIKRSGKEIKFK